MSHWGVVVGGGHPGRMLLPASRVLLEAAGVSTTLPSGKPDPGLVIGHDITAFIRAVVRFRHTERHAAPPAH